MSGSLMDIGKIRFTPHTLYPMDSKMNLRFKYKLKMKCKNIKREHGEIPLSSLGMGETFLTMTQNPDTIVGKINEFDGIKMENTCIA